MDSAENQARFEGLLGELKAQVNDGMPWRFAASEARVDKQFPEIRRQQHANGMYREDGYWLLDISPDTACEWGRRFKQDAIVYAEAGKMAQLLACGKSVERPVTIN